jgi:pantothenate kinase
MYLFFTQMIRPAEMSTSVKEEIRDINDQLHMVRIKFQFLPLVEIIRYNIEKNCSFFTKKLFA